MGAKTWILMYAESEPAAILRARPVLERVTSVTIDRDYRKKQDGLIASDHAPVYADLA